ncbi:MAG: Jag N-terminal domain-containing protein [candidate division WOR-3 bacterium]
MAHERFIDIVGNTVEECIERALNEFGLEKGKLKFAVLHDGISEKPAKIRVCLKPEEVNLLEEIFKGIFGRIDPKFELEIIPRDKRYSINVNIRNAQPLIGKNGATLEQIEYLINLILKRKSPDLVVKLDINNFRKEKEETLKNKALAIVTRVRELRKEMRFDPVDDEEFRILRDFLKNIKDIRFYPVKDQGKTVLVIAPR